MHFSGQPDQKQKTFCTMMNFNLPKEQSSIIKVVGVGGGGSNAVNHMFNQGIKGVDFLVCNTDKQALDISPVPTRIVLGESLTDGRGAGSVPEIGRNAAIENIEDIKAILSQNTKMVFVTAGMGGGTGTGAAPVIANTAREMDILTVGIVTVPFSFEGRKRRIQAEEGIAAMRDAVDTLLVINNDRLREMYGNLSLVNAFEEADNVLSTAAKGIAEVITVTGKINVDFEDVKTVMKDSGVAIMGSACAEGENRAITAVEQALSSPLLNDNNITGAKYVLLNITYGNAEVLMDEITDITDFIQEEAGDTADVIWGHGYDENLEGQLSITIIATGFHTHPETGSNEAGHREKKYISLEADVPTMITQPMESPTQHRSAEQRIGKEPSVPSTREISREQWHTEPHAEPEGNPASTGKKEAAEEQIAPYLKTEDHMSSSAHQGNLFEQKATERPTEQVKRYNLYDEADASAEAPFQQNVTPQPRETKPEPAFQPERRNVPDVEKKEASVNPAYPLTKEEQKRRSAERIARIKELSMKLKTPSGLADLENEPAYKRRNVHLNTPPHSSESTVSRFTLSEEEGEDGERRTEIRPNNSFLHDNVD